MNRSKTVQDLVLAIVLCCPTWLAAEITPARLRCEYADNPMGIDADPPRLSWILESEQRAQRQTAYQILAAANLETLQADKGDLWESGKVASDQSIHVLYKGKQLASGMRVWWKVRVWDQDGKVSAYSEPAWWEMGLLKPQDWQGTWIRRNKPAPATDAAFYQDDPAPLLRKEFTVDKPVRRARLYVTGLGYHEARLNGRKIGDQLLDPGWTTYSKRVFYSTYDVTSLLKNSKNALGVMLGNGWYNPLPLRMWGRFNLRESLTIGLPRLILQLNIEYADGTRQAVVSDESWKVGDGPILRNNVYLGETYDARREQPAWDSPGFHDSAWAPVVPATEPLGPLQAQPIPPIRATATLKPVKITEPKPGIFIVDMGQNFAGRVVLRAKGPAGTRVCLRYGELLYPDGTLNGMTTVCGQIKREGVGGPGAPAVAFQQDTYVLRGEGQEVYSPRFTFHGFRYVEITGYPGRPTADDLIGQRLNSDVAPVGTFSCSNEMFNRIQRMVQWTELSNLFSVQSDCPAREKFGYGGDIIATSEMAIFNFDMARFHAKTVRDHADAARPNGGITETAPFVGIGDGGFGDGCGPIGWGTAHPLLQWQLYQYYGDRRLLEEQYETAVRWIELLRANAPDHIVDKGISDHESLVEKPVALTGTAFYYYNVKLLAQIAAILNRTPDAERYEKLAGDIKQAFCKKFLHADTGALNTGSQACQAFGLFFDLVPPERRSDVLNVLVKDVLDKQKGHLTTGIFGTKYMLSVLSGMDRADVAYTIVNQKTFPGWGHMLEKGATTLWEHWEFSDNTFSHNHPMFGSVSEWFYKVPGGINPDPAAVGFDRIILRPQPGGDLTWVKATYDSVRGKIVSDWKIENDRLMLNVTVPPNTLATLVLRARDPNDITEGGKPAAKVEGIVLLRHDASSATFTIPSGRYAFALPAPRQER